MQATLGYPDRISIDRIGRRRPSRTYRRMRTLRLAGLMLVLLIALFVAPRVVQTAPGSASAGIGHTYTVAPGDSLWSIASQFSPGQDQRKVVAAIKQANNLGTAHIEPGQTLVIPGSVMR